MEKAKKTLAELEIENAKLKFTVTKRNKTIKNQKEKITKLEVLLNETEMKLQKCQAGWKNY